MQRFTLVLAAVCVAAPLAAQAPSLGHARTLMEARNYEAAKIEYAVLARTSPNDPQPLIGLGQVAMAEDNADAAIRHFERCVSVRDDLSDCHLWLGTAVGMSAQHASKLRLPFVARRAKKEFERAVELDPNSIEARSGVLQFYLLAPGFLGGDVARARVEAGAIGRRNSMRGALAMAMIDERSKMLPEAEADLKRAMAVAPDSQVANSAQIGFYSRQKRWADAFAALDRFVARFPAEKNAWLTAARLSVQSGDQIVRGEAAVRRWIADPPEDAAPRVHSIAHERLGWFHERAGRKEQARVEYQRAVALDAKNEDARKALEGV